MRFSQKLFLGFGAVIFLLAIASLGGAFSIQFLNKEYSSLLNTEKRILQKAEAIKTAALEAREEEKNFQLTLDTVCVPRFKQHIEDVISLCDSIDSLVALDDELKVYTENTKKVRDVITQYSNGFKEIVAKNIEKGLDEESKMRLDFKIAKFGLTNVLISGKIPLSAKISRLGFKMTRYDILPGSVEPLKKDYQMFNSLLGTEEIEMRDNFKLKKMTKKYVTSFEQMVIIDNDIKRIEKDFQTSVEQINPIITEFVDAISARASSSQKSLESTAAYINRIIAALTVVVIVLSIIFTMKMVQSILKHFGSEPKDVVEIAESVARGKLDIDFEKYEHSKNTGIFKAIKHMVFDLQKECLVASKISNGDLTERAFIASDEDALGMALDKMVISLNHIVHGINESAEQLTLSSTQIQNASQDLANMSTEQSVAIDTLFSSVTRIGEQAVLNADKATSTDAIVSKTAKVAEDGSKKIEILTTTMDEISSSSDKVVNVIKVIDDISFQTNLLALNAAVEAARAGQHGKGFAVVADEVRNLANRSAKAAQETADLIAANDVKVKSGSEIMQETTEVFNIIVSEVKDITTLVSEIKGNTSKQSEALENIKESLNQLSKTIQSNSASSEETAAASEEMASQAFAMRELIQYFTTSDDVTETTDGNDYRDSAPYDGDEYVQAE